jgi:transposase-like protein
MNTAQNSTTTTTRRHRSPSVHKIRHSIPQEEKDQAIAMYKSGAPAKEVASAWRIGVSSLYAFVRAKEKAEARRNVRMQRKQNTPTTESNAPAQQSMPEPVRTNGHDEEQELRDALAKKDQEIQRLKDLLIEALLK